jgi:hypothetical protein
VWGGGGEEGEEETVGDERVERVQRALWNLDIQVCVLHTVL